MVSPSSWATSAVMLSNPAVLFFLVLWLLSPTLLEEKSDALYLVSMGSQVMLCPINLTVVNVRAVLGPSGKDFMLLCKTFPCCV